jgi:hypothetical protein
MISKVFTGQVFSQLLLSLPVVFVGVFQFFSDFLHSGVILSTRNKPPHARLGIVEQWVAIAEREMCEGLDTAQQRQQSP